MYKMGDVIELECYIDAMYIEKCNSGYNNELRKYRLRYAINDRPAGVYEYKDFIPCEGCAWVGAKVKVKATITGIDVDLYYIKLSNGRYAIIDKADLPILFKIGDKVTVDFDIRMYTSTLKHRGKDIFDIYEELTFMVRLPGTNKVIEILPIGRINKQVITCDGTVIKTHDNGKVDIRFDDLNLTYTLDLRFVNKVEEWYLW